MHKWFAETLSGYIRLPFYYSTNITVTRKLMACIKCTKFDKKTIHDHLTQRPQRWKNYSKSHSVSIYSIQHNITDTAAATTTTNNNNINCKISSFPNTTLYSWIIFTPSSFITTHLPSNTHCKLPTTYHTHPPS